MQTFCKSLACSLRVFWRSPMWMDWHSSDGVYLQTFCKSLANFLKVDWRSLDWGSYHSSNGGKLANLLQVTRYGPRVQGFSSRVHLSDPESHLSDSRSLAVCTSITYSVEAISKQTKDLSSQVLSTWVTRSFYTFLPKLKVCQHSSWIEKHSSDYSGITLEYKFILQITTSLRIQILLLTSVYTWLLTTYTNSQCY